MGVGIRGAGSRLRLERRRGSPVATGFVAWPLTDRTVPPRGNRHGERQQRAGQGPEEGQGRREEGGQGRAREARTAGQEGLTAPGGRTAVVISPKESRCHSGCGSTTASGSAPRCVGSRS